jgi:hypothetical protein
VKCVYFGVGEVLLQRISFIELLVGGVISDSAYRFLVGVVTVDCVY